MSSTQPYDARKGTGDPQTDPAAVGETSVEQPDGDGGAVVEQEPVQEPGTGGS